MSVSLARPEPRPASRPVLDFPPAPICKAEERRQRWQEHRVRLLRACRLLRMGLGLDRRPGGSLEDLRDPPAGWVVRALCLVASAEIEGIDRPGVKQALVALGQKKALAALLELEEHALRLRRE